MKHLWAGATVSVAAGLVLAALPASSDDWPQFQRDGARSGASLDPVKFPLTDVWTWETLDLENQSPLVNVAIWKDAAYFTASDGAARFLICAEAKTGAVRWRRQLASLRIREPYSNLVGPAVSTSGKVFVYDWQNGKEPPVYSVLSRRASRAGVAANLAEIRGFVVRVYDARDGRLLDFLPLGGLGVTGSPPQLSLVHAPHPLGLHPTPPVVFPAPPWRDYFGSQYLGHPLLTGEELTATGITDLFLKWTPGGAASLSLVNHPLPGQDPDATPPAQFWQYTPVAVGGGALVVDDTTHRFLSVLNGPTASRWQRDLQTFAGPAAADNEAVFLGLGGGTANRALACLDAGTGQLRWLYAPQGLPPDRQIMRDQPVSRLARKLVVLGEGQQPPPRTTDELRAFTERALRQGIVTEIRPETLNVPQPYTPVTRGLHSATGPVVSEGRLFADVGQVVTALDQRTGAVLWRQPLAEGVIAIRALAGAREHLLATYLKRPQPRQLNSAEPAQPFLAALRKDNGKILWQTRVSKAGVVSLAGGLVYLGNGTLTAMAPAERTYRLAADSDDPKAYGEGPFNPPAPAGEEAENKGGVAEGPADPVLPPDLQGDASVLRLPLDRPAEELIARARERRGKIGLLPLVIRLDGLNTPRTTLLGPGAPRWTPERSEAFAALCTRLVEAAQPHYIDIAPEFNVYLRHHPEEGPAMLSLFRKAVAAVHAGAAGCKVLASLDVEVLAGLYGEGRVLPYGELPKLKRGESPAPPELPQLVRELDAIGLTSHPQAAFRYPKQMPGDHLLRMRRWVGEQKPLLVLPGGVHIDTRGLADQMRQASFAHRLHQACYWLDAEIVAPPRITLAPDAMRAVPAQGVDPAKLESERWRRGLLFERVGALTVPSPLRPPPLP